MPTIHSVEPMIQKAFMVYLRFHDKYVVPGTSLVRCSSLFLKWVGGLLGDRVKSLLFLSVNPSLPPLLQSSSCRY